MTKCIWCWEQDGTQELILDGGKYSICTECNKKFYLLIKHPNLSGQEKKKFNNKIAEIFLSTGDENLLRWLIDERSDEEIKNAAILRERSRLMANMYNY